jgi:hypothetical protein
VPEHERVSTPCSLQRPDTWIGLSLGAAVVGAEVMGEGRRSTLASKPAREFKHVDAGGECAAEHATKPKTDAVLTRLTCGILAAGHSTESQVAASVVPL